MRRAYENETLDEKVFQSVFEIQLIAFQKHVQRLVTFSPAIRSGLEVGSYVGAFLAAARDAGLPFMGLDISRGAVAFAAKHGLRVANCAMEELRCDGEYDAITIWNTFEQLPDVRSAVLTARRLLNKKGQKPGVLVVRVPNSVFYSRWRSRLQGPFAAVAERLLVHNNLLGFPYREGFSPPSMQTLLEDAGFRIRRVYGDTLVPIADRWTKSVGAAEERLTKQVQRILQRGWRAPWLEVYDTPR